MSQDDITILPEVFAMSGHAGRLYYYQGNFYMPVLLRGDQVGKVRRAVREFGKANRELVDSDRSHPDYKTLVEIFDEVMP